MQQTFEINEVQFQQLLGALHEQNEILKQLDHTLSQVIATSEDAEKIKELTAKLKGSSVALANAVSAEETPQEEK